MRAVRVLLGLLAAVAGSAGALRPCLAQTVEEFYKGRQVGVLIGFGPGGANDAWARALARHMPKHLPGNPTLVPQNMPGAGTLQLANRLSNTAPKDGSVFGLISRGIPFEPLLGGQSVQLDPTKMGWIGSPDRDTTVCAARKDSGVRTVADLRSRELKVGATGSGADTAIYPEFLAELLGLKFRTIKGYPGSNEIFLAMERNEVDGICIAYDSLARQPMLAEGRVAVLFQAALAKDATVPADVPLALDLAATDAERETLKLFLARVAVGRPFVAPPGVPADRLEALRRAFDATMTDPEFVAEATKQRLAIDPIAGQAIADTIASAYAAPPDVVRRVADTLGRIAK